MKAAPIGLTNFLTAAALRQSPRLVHDQFKRPLDLVLSLFGLVLAAPLMLVLAVAIKLTSRGPVFYVQERVGQGGNHFWMWKLRTMNVDAEVGGPAWSRHGDPRVTPVGRFLRRAHLDELPQLWNIFRGDMSLIGPRPERPHFVKQLRQSIPLYTARLIAKPGLTGLAQVKHHYDRSIEDVQAKLGYDLEYIKRACLALDLQILALTVVKVLSGRGGSC